MDVLVLFSCFSLNILFKQAYIFQSFTRDKKTKRNHIPQIVKSAGFFKTILKIKNEKTVKAILNKAHKGR